MVATASKKQKAPLLDIENDPDRLVDILTVMGLTGQTRSQAYATAASGAWEVVQTGPRSIRVKLASVRRWIAANTRNAENDR